MSRTNSRCGAILVTLVIVACGSSEDRASGQRLELQPAKTIAARLADEGCVCSTLECIDGVQTKFKRMVEGSHQTPESNLANTDANRKLTQCVTSLGREFGRRVEALSDELCACVDRACYDALRPKVERVFNRRNIAAIPPPLLREIKHIVKRFEACDAKFSRPPGQQP